MKPYLRSSLTSIILFVFALSLSSTAGVAWDKGLIKSVDEKVHKYMPVEHFNSEHNSKIT